jgi:hypothetical protein
MADVLSQADKAYDQVVGWLEHLEVLDDPRQAGKVAYPLDDDVYLESIITGVG